MSATIYKDSRVIMVTGAIATNQNDIQVLIPKLPVGKWRVIRAQNNYTNRIWKSWQIPLVKIVDQ